MAGGKAPNQVGMANAEAQDVMGAADQESLVGEAGPEIASHLVSVARRPSKLKENPEAFVCGDGRLPPVDRLVGKKVKAVVAGEFS